MPATMRPPQSLLLALLLAAAPFAHAAAELRFPCSLNSSCAPAVPPPRGCAFVTLVTGTDSGYVQGAIALSGSLNAVGSKVPRLCMVTPDVPAELRARLEADGYETIQVQPIACKPTLNIRAIRKTDIYNNFCTKVGELD